jgi:hypothetical protein
MKSTTYEDTLQSSVQRQECSVDLFSTSLKAKHDTACGCANSSCLTRSLTLTIRWIAQCRCTDSSTGVPRRLIQCETFNDVDACCVGWVSRSLGSLLLGLGMMAHTGHATPCNTGANSMNMRCSFKKSYYKCGSAIAHSPRMKGRSAFLPDVNACFLLIARVSLLMMWASVIITLSFVHIVVPRTLV